MSLTMGNNANTTHVATTNNHSKISCVKLDEINDFASLDLQHHSVMDSNERVRIADGTTIMGNKVRDTLSTCGYTSHLTKLVLQNKDTSLANDQLSPNENNQKQLMQSNTANKLIQQDLLM